ncbi:MAG: UvrD-helicase domain-containing protein, partial [Phycisphaerales bacterium]|nr:UvrD-helicase domain-containing protein [Phycisphaerales bacterium]
MFAFTEEQQRAVETVDRSVLVSAAAGSGKTAVLAARCAHLVCDAPPPYRCDVDELLVVTFTEAAASEMKERIGKALRTRCADAPDDRRLRAQVALVDTAQISTLHAFCLWMVRRWFDRVGVDATAQMLDGDEARLLRQDTLAQVFDELYAGDADLAVEFKKLVDDYGLGYDGSIGEFVLRLSAFAVSQENPADWLARARDTSPQRLTGIVAETARALRVELERQAEHCREMANVVARCFAAGTFYGDLLSAHAEQLTQWASRLAEGESWESVRAEIAACEMSSKGAPSISKDAPEEVRAERDNARNLFNEARDGLLKKRLQAQLCRFTETEMIAELTRTAPYLHALIDLTNAFLDAYARQKRTLGVMDFADLERFAYDLLMQTDAGDEDATIAEQLRSRF